MPAFSCPVDATPVALVDTGLSSIPTPIEVRGGPDGSWCRASLHLSVLTLPSRSLVPVPRELAEQLVPIARAFGMENCEIQIFTDDESAPAEERYGPDSCRRGEFRYDDSSWWAVGQDGPCWE
jgi:hypothetical protein